MKEKFLQFFTGKLSKSIYIAVASAVVCGVAVITTVVVVHNNNQRLDTALESLNEQTATMAQTESATEDVSVTEGNDTTVPAQAANNEPTGDRSLQYLAEYNRITEEYERERAELEKEASKQNLVPMRANIINEPYSREAYEDETPEEYAAYLETFQEQYRQWESESQQADEFNRVEQSRVDAFNAKIAEAKKQLEQLERQYEEDVAALKAKYGVS